jgi:hypothetical protein
VRGTGKAFIIDGQSPRHPKPDDRATETAKDAPDDAEGCP